MKRSAKAPARRMRSWPSRDVLLKICNKWVHRTLFFRALHSIYIQSFFLGLKVVSTPKTLLIILVDPLHIAEGSTGYVGNFELVINWTDGEMQGRRIGWNLPVSLL